MTTALLWAGMAAVFAASAIWLRSFELAQSGMICCGFATVLFRLRK